MALVEIAAHDEENSQYHKSDDLVDRLQLEDVVRENFHYWNSQQAQGPDTNRPDIFHNADRQHTDGIEGPESG